MARRRTAADRTAAEQVEWMRALLAFMLVGAFIGGGGAMFVFVIPAENKDVLTYMVGQLSGMALTVLGFYFMDKVGQAAIDAKKSENTGKLADLANRALDIAPAGDAAADAAKETADAAVEKADEIAHHGPRPADQEPPL